MGSHVQEVLAQRTASYGSLRLNMFVTQWLLVIARGHTPLPNALLEGTAFMVCQKAARMIVGGQTGDSLVDMKGYTTRCLEELTVERWPIPEGLQRRFELTVEPHAKLPKAAMGYIERFLTALQKGLWSGSRRQLEACMKEMLREEPV